MLFTIMESTPIGPLTIASEGGRICRLGCGAARESEISKAEGTPEDRKVLDRAVQELEAYFSGDLREFTVPVHLRGPAFHERVWRHLLKIPYGQAETYSEIARSLGTSLAARAVGNACARNPVAIIVPCHRVLAQGGLGGFGGGLEVKRWLLKHEGCARAGV